MQEFLNQPYTGTLRDMASQDKGAHIREVSPIRTKTPEESAV